MRNRRNLSRRQFLARSTTLAAISIVPRHVLGGPGRVPPSDRLNVAVIGTGATGVQTIQEVAKTVGHLTVFQRRPNWCKPLHNGPISKAEMEEIRAASCPNCGATIKTDVEKLSLSKGDFFSMDE